MVTVAIVDGMLESQLFFIYLYVFQVITCLLHLVKFNIMKTPLPPPPRINVQQ